MFVQLSYFEKIGCTRRTDRRLMWLPGGPYNKFRDSLLQYEATLWCHLSKFCETKAPHCSYWISWFLAISRITRNVLFLSPHGRCD